MDGILLTDITTWGPWIIAWGANLLTAILILALGWWLSSLLGSTVHRAAIRSGRIDPTIVPMLRTAVVWAIRVFTVIAVLARFGVQTASVIAVLGAAGLAIGLALQGTLQNIAAGIMLISLRPLRTGEYVKLSNGYEGSVAEVGLFLTRLVQGDGIITSLPNSSVWSATIVNFSRNLTRRLDVELVVRFGDDLDLALATLKGLLADHPLVHKDPAPQVLVTGNRDNGVVVLMRMWTDAGQHWNLQCDLFYQSRQRLESIGLRHPIPVRGIEEDPREQAPAAPQDPSLQSPGGVA